MEFSPDSCYVMLDRMLGGQGNITHNNNNDLTEIEISVIQTNFYRALKVFKKLGCPY